MNRIYIKDLNNYFDKEVEVSGYIDNIRNLQYVCFIILRDISGKVQLTIEKNEENLKLNEIVNGLTLSPLPKVVAVVPLSVFVTTA